MVAFLRCSVHELICSVKLSSRCGVHILILLASCRYSFKMKIPLNLIDEWDNYLRIFLTDMSFCHVRQMWLWVCWVYGGCCDVGLQFPHLTGLSRLAHAVFCLHSQIWMYFTNLKSCLAFSSSFSRLFSSSSNTAKKPEPPVNVKYNAPTSHITPSVKKRSSTLSQLPSDKSKAFEFLSEE